MEENKKIPVTSTALPPKRKTLAELFAETCAVKVVSSAMHQAFQIPGAGTESSINTARKGMKQIELVYHPGYGLIGRNNGKYFVSPHANMIVGHE